MPAIARPKPYVVSIRLPQHLAHALRQLAQRNERSVNSEIIVALEAHLARAQKGPPS